MPSKRTVIELLNKNELQTIVTEYDLTVADKRVKDQLVDAVASSRKATLEAVLPALSRDRLKALCRAVDLDDSGREKAPLIDRLSGTLRPPTSKISPKQPEGSEGGPVIEKRRGGKARSLPLEKGAGGNSSKPPTLSTVH